MWHGTYLYSEIFHYLYEIQIMLDVLYFNLLNLAIIDSGTNIYPWKAA